MRLPDFLIIGAARSGTTSLYECLKKFETIYLPLNKRPEPHFFLRDQEYSLGLSYYSDKYFKDVPLNLIAGEVSTSYIYSEKVACRIARDLKNIKIIAILRDPADRALSHYFINKKNGLENLSLLDAINAEENRLKHPKNIFELESSPFSYIDRGQYFNQLHRYAAVIDKSKIHCIIFEEILKRPQSVFQKLFKFLEIEEPNEISWGKVFNANPHKYMSSYMRKYIIKMLYSDIVLLEKFLEKDLSHWKQC